jgi:hypothetical protein
MSTVKTNDSLSRWLRTALLIASASTATVSAQTAPAWDAAKAANNP